MSLRRLAENLGFFKALAYRFFPPYQLWFVLTRWADTRDYFAFFISGLITVTIGVAVIITSPTYKAAEESDRAYQSMVDEWVRGKAPPASDEKNGRSQELVTASPALARLRRSRISSLFDSHRI